MFENYLVPGAVRVIKRFHPSDLIEYHGILYIIF